MGEIFKDWKQHQVPSADFWGRVEKRSLALRALQTVAVLLIFVSGAILTVHVLGELEQNRDAVQTIREESERAATIYLEAIQELRQDVARLKAKETACDVKIQELRRDVTGIDAGWRNDLDLLFQKERNLRTQVAIDRRGPRYDPGHSAWLEKCVRDLYTRLK